MQPGTPLPYLAEVADELRAEGQDLRLSLALSDRLLIARLALEDAPDTSWDYLIGAWVRCKRVESTLGGPHSRTCFTSRTRRISGSGVSK